jgi:hypothetical protein
MKLIWLSAYFAGLVWSVINPQDYITWVFKIARALIGFVSSSCLRSS